MTTIGDMRRRTCAAWGPLWDAIGLPDDARIDDLRKRWTPEVAIEVARLDGHGHRVGAVRWLDGVLGTDALAGADLRGADLRGAHLDRVCAYGADMRGADLRYASMRRMGLDGADMRGACMRRANLYMASLAGASLDGADMRRAHLMLADVTGASFDGARVALDGARGRELLAPWAS